MTEYKTEYITKEQALEAIKGKMWPGEFEAAIKAIPAVDAAPVIYAQWSLLVKQATDSVCIYVQIVEVMLLKVIRETFVPNVEPEWTVKTYEFYC